MAPNQKEVILGSDRAANKEQFKDIPDGRIGVFTYELNLIFYVRDSYVYQLKKLAVFTEIDIVVIEQRGWFRSMIFVKIEGEKEKLLEMFDNIVTLHEKFSNQMLTVADTGK
jgi:hypothetical protein